MHRKKPKFKADGTRDMDANPSFCMAPFTHTYLSPQSERRLCCASREQPQYVRQYIDSGEGQSQEDYAPLSLEEHWNSDFLKRVRSQMLRGEAVPECDICTNQILNLSTYRAWFTDYLFREQIDKAFELTDDTGFTQMKTVSFDYRINNACNFKCRMCGHQLSSSWEIELRKHSAWSPIYDAWMTPEMGGKIKDFQKNVAEKEFIKAAHDGQVEEIYWVGGEPLVWDIHWRLMKDLCDMGYASKVYCRYNTNLSKIEHKGVSLFKDILPQVKDYIMCCSIDGVGQIGEWIRTGLNWETWVKYFDEGLKVPDKRDRMKMDLTLTLPGLFSLKEYVEFAVSRDVEILSKLVFGFSPDKVISPMALPREVLDPFLKRLTAEIKLIAGPKQKSVVDLLEQMLTRQTFAEEFGAEKTAEELKKGKAFLQQVAGWRGDGQPGKAMRLEDILATHPPILNWWNSL